MSYVQNTERHANGTGIDAAVRNWRDTGEGIPWSVAAGIAAGYATPHGSALTSFAQGQIIDLGALTANVVHEIRLLLDGDDAENRQQFAELCALLAFCTSVLEEHTRAYEEEL